MVHHLFHSSGKMSVVDKKDSKDLWDVLHKICETYTRCICFAIILSLQGFQSLTFFSLYGYIFDWGVEPEHEVHKCTHGTVWAVYLAVLGTF